MPLGNRRVQKPKFCHLGLFPVFNKNVETLCLDNPVKIENFQKIFSRVVSFMVLSKICENETFLKHSLLQVA